MAKKDRYDFDTADDDLGQTDDSDTTDNEEDEEEDVAADAFETTTESVDDTTAGTRDDTTTTSDEQTTSGASDSGSTSQSAPEEVPHRVGYDSPKAERDQKMFYLNDEDLDRLSELERLAESEFDKNIHATDVRLAAFRSDLTETAFLSEMRTIGYGYFDE